MSKPRHFFRIEHKEQKIGPYRCTVYNPSNGFREDFIWIVSDKLNRGLSTSWKNCPTPSEEDLPTDLWKNNSARYGFASLSKLRKWFGCRKALYALMEEYGFVLRRYTVDSGDMFTSPTQCIVMVGDLVDFEELDFSVIYKKA